MRRQPENPKLPAISIKTGEVSAMNENKALALHEQWNGKIETTSKAPVKTREDLALAYTNTPRRRGALQGDCKG